MSDDLRTRIAKVLYRCDYGLRDWEKATDEGKQAYYDDADVLIRELGLQPHLAKRIINGKPDQWVRRHVTDWEIVE